MKQSFIPGMEIDEEENLFHEGAPKPNVKYFDASLLPDAPSYQRNANNNQTYILHIIFPSWNSLKEGVSVLTGGERNSLAQTAKLATVSSIMKHKKSGLSLIDFWKQKILGITVEVPLDEMDAEDSEEDAQEPIGSSEDEEDGSTANVPAKKTRIRSKQIPIKTAYPKISLEGEKAIVAFPSYRRSKEVKTFKYLDPGSAICFVEPQELADYSDNNPSQKFYVFSRPGMTISQKRNTIVKEAIKAGCDWLFMLEDDLTGFFKREGKTTGGSHKLVKAIHSEVMSEMLSFAKANCIAELGLSQQQSNHFYEEELAKFSCKTTEFCLFDLRILEERNINYDVELPQFEDFDISIQLLKAGCKVALFTPYAFGHVTMGTNAGGHQADGERKDRTIASIDRMVTKYPGFVEYKEGRLFPEPKVNWTALRNGIEDESQ